MARAQPAGDDQMPTITLAREDGGGGRPNQPGAGRVPPLLGVNGAPLFAPSSTPGSSYDVATLYAELGITSVRTHDGPFDPCKVYLGSVVTKNGSSATSCNPMTLASDTVEWTANTASFPLGDPASYSWSALDPSAAAIASAGAKAYVRVGESWNGVNLVTGGAVADYARVAEELVGHIATLVDIDRAEIWNEPDLGTGSGGRFWKGSRAQFYDLYDDLVTVATNPLGLITGGSGFGSDVIEQWTDDIVVHWPTDAHPDGDTFLSGHYYGECASATEQSLVAWLDQVRANMTGAGLGHRPLHVTEWNIDDLGSGGDNCAEFGTPTHGSYVAAALLLMSQVEFNIRRSHFYAGVGNGPSALFSPSGNDVAISPAAWGFWGYGAIASRQRIPTTQIWSTGSGSPADAARAGQRWFGQFAQSASGTWFLEIINDQPTSMNVRVVVGGVAGPAAVRQVSGLAVTPVPAGTSSAHVVTAADAASAFAVPSTSASWTVNGGNSELVISLPANSITTLEW